MRKLLLLSLLGLSFLTGCATLNAISSTVAVALADGIEFGTAEYISHHAAGARPERPGSRADRDDVGRRLVARPGAAPNWPLCVPT